MSRSFVLASGSPRRRDLLVAAGYRFDVWRPNVREISSPALTLCEVALRNAMRKGLTAARAQPDAVVLSADTLVALDGEVFGKPLDLDDAMKTLRRLSDRTHDVCTAVFICDRGGFRTLAFEEVSSVRFRRLNEDAIRAYLAKVDPLDKAGAYAAQGHGAEIIARIVGSRTNVIGLPMEKTIAALRSFGVKPERP